MSRMLPSGIGARAQRGNAKTVLVQCMVEKEIYAFSFDGKTLQKTTAIKVNGGPAGIRTAEP